MSTLTIHDALPAASPTLGPHDALTIAASLADLQLVESGWLELRRHFSRNTPNSDPAHFSAVIQTMAAANPSVSPYVALFRNASGNPCGLILGRTQDRTISCNLGYAALKTPTLHCLEIIYGGLITDGHDTSRNTLVAHLHNLVRSGQFEHIFINHLPMAHELFAPLSAQHAIVKPPELHWQLLLTPGSMAQSLELIAKKHGHNGRQKDHALTRKYQNDVKLRRFELPDQLAEFIQGTAAIAARTYQHGMGVGFADTPVWHAILSVEARRRQFRGYWLLAGGRPIAFQVGLISGSTYYLQTIGFDPDYRQRSPGIVLHLHVIDDLCKSPLLIRSIDYGFGDAAYKRTYGTGYWEEATLHLYASTPRAFCARALDRAATAANRLALRLPHGLDIGHPLKKLWRRHFQHKCSDSRP